MVVKSFNRTMQLSCHSWRLSCICQETSLLLGGGLQQWRSQDCRAEIGDDDDDDHDHDDDDEYTRIKIKALFQQVTYQ